MDYDGGMPGGDVSDLTMRKLAHLRDDVKRDRLAVAALVAGLFPSSQQALDRLETVLAAPDPPAGRTLRHKHVEQLAADTRMWLREIQPALQVMAAAERARAEDEAANSKLGSDAKTGDGDSSPAAGLSGDELLQVAGHTSHGKLPREALIRRAVADPGQFVARKPVPPRWSGDTEGVEPLHIWQARAVVVALELSEIALELSEIEARRG